MHLSKFLERYPGLHTILRLDKFLIFQDSICVTVNLRLLCSDFARFFEIFQFMKNSRKLTLNYRGQIEAIHFWT